MKYRPEIDGLRAIAVLSVLIYHAKFALPSGILISGGFLGVDLFFVISGYLISKIILQQSAAGNFNYIDFYDRRARRILPALFVVILASTPFAWFWMLPDQLIEYSESLLGALFFSSNFVFLSQDSYTAEPSLLKPFLHTWSLGIEEQFYIILPVALLFIVKRYSAKHLLVFILLALIVSLAFSQAISTRYSDANFFLLSSRAWELLAGSVVAFVDLNAKKNLGASRFAGLISTLSLLIIIAALFTFDESTRHPSLLTALPVFSCAALIAFSNGKHFVNHFLSHPLFVKIGLISYSLYLWHFPVFAFFRLHLGEPSSSYKIGLCLLSFVLAIASYLWIEKPFRNKQKISSTLAIKVLLITFLMIVGFQLSVLVNQGYAQRLGNVSSFITNSQPVRLQNGASPDTALNPLVALGDSHAGIFSSKLRTLAQSLNRPFIQIAQDGCPLVLGVYLFTDGKRFKRCENIAQARVDAIKHFNQGIFFYSGRFALYENGKRFGEESGYPVLMTTRQDGKPSPDELLTATIATIEGLLNSGTKLVLVYPIPEMGFDVPKAFKERFKNISDLSLKAHLRNRPLNITKDRYLERANNVINAFDSIKDHTNLIRLKPDEVLCDQQRCYAHNDEFLYYYDDNHLSPQAANMLIQSLTPNLRKRHWIE